MSGNFVPDGFILHEKCVTRSLGGKSPTSGVRIGGRHSGWAGAVCVNSRLIIHASFALEAVSAAPLAPAHWHGDELFFHYERVGLRT